MSKYITTSIAYINAEPHIGFLFELVAADVLARYHKLQGDDVYFVTGTDEHGQKVQQAIAASGIEAQAYADNITASFVQLTEDFNISNDYFIRTTNPDHQTFVTARWQQLEKAGLLEKRTYAGLYCPGCEAFKTEAEIVDGKCVIHERELEKTAEDNWFFIITAEAKEKIAAWINGSVFPETRRQEVINSLESGHFDAVSVSRPKSKLSWGVPVPDDDSQTMYVWVDALFNYISALEINDKTNLWPANIQVIGKDILKFHAIIWPALLLACDYELPKKLLVHGFINVDGKKMSKSLGNVITPAALLERYGVDGTRYLLLRQLNFYDDSNFVWDEFDAIYNGELANGIGNLLNRSLALLKKFDCAGAIELALTDEDEKVSLEDLAEQDFRGALEEINSQIAIADNWFSNTKPWEWEAPSDLQKALLIDQSRLVKISYQLEPFMPTTAIEIRRQLTELDSKPLFPRIEK